MFANDNDDQFPAQVSTHQGGTKELLQPNGVVAQFAAISNIILTPKILICSADAYRQRAIRFEGLTNSNISYFINADAGMANTNQIFVGDDHLTSDTATTSGFATLQPNSKLRWRGGRHLERRTFVDRPKGNVAFVDGSVRHIGHKELTDVVGRQGNTTNRLLKSNPPVK